MTTPNESESERSERRVVRVELLTHEGCPRAERARSLLHECLAEVGLTTPVIERVGAYPSPTVLVDGCDVMGAPQPAVRGAVCRLDPPTRAWVLRALLPGAVTFRRAGP